MDSKSLKIYTLLVVAVILIIVAINYIKGDGNGTEEEIDCIAKNSLLFVKEGCSACAYQENLIGEENLDKFDITDCAYEPEKCAEFEIEKVPTWIIDGEKYEGTHLVEEIKELTGC